MRLVVQVVCHLQLLDGDDMYLEWQLSRCASVYVLFPSHRVLHSHCSGEAVSCWRMLDGAPYYTRAAGTSDGQVRVVGVGGGGIGDLT